MKLNEIKCSVCPIFLNRAGAGQSIGDSIYPADCKTCDIRQGVPRMVDMYSEDLIKVEEQEWKQ